MRISKEAILSTLPRVLAEDKEMTALAEPIAEALAERIPEIDLVRLYTRIDELPEELLDILAYDFKADWWEYDATLEEKRAVFKKIWFVHRHKGTKASVETAIGALYPGAEASEWFDYGGEPYHFRMSVPIREQQVRDAAQDYKNRVFFLVNYFKNLRSVLETIYFTFDTELETMLYTLSHFGGRLSVTPVPEWFPKFPDDVGLYVSGMMPRWEKVVILNDVTEDGLVIITDGETGSVKIGGMRVWEDPSDLSLNLECPGLVSTQNGSTINISDH